MKELFIIKRKNKSVFSYLAEAEKFVAVHPLIYKMIEIKQNEYNVFEKINTILFPVTFTYKASIISESFKDKVSISASVKGMAKINIVFNLTSVPGGTLVAESITINSLLPIKNRMLRFFMVQHAVMFKNIESAIIE